MADAINNSKIPQLLYRDCLDSVERERYGDKLRLIAGNDPYELKTWSTEVNLLPTISYPDIVNYLVFSPSPYTMDDLKCFKGLEDYNQFVSVFVREKTTIVINNLHVVKSKVLHSQRLREKPLMPWIIAQKDGKVVGAHCNCMAGLGEVCTHISALLFAIEGTVKIRDSRTVTQEPAYWMLPSSAPGISYREVRHMDFTSAKSLKRKFDDACGGTPGRHSDVEQSSRKTAAVPEPTAEDFTRTLDLLHSAGQKSAILSVVQPYAQDFIPKAISEIFPTVLTELRDEGTFALDFKALLEECSNIKISVSAAEASNVENATRDQAESKLWFQFRSGRITASRMKSVCVTDPTNPSQSLIKSVCYPNNYFSNEATKWGCDHAKIARDLFVEKMKEFHQNLTVDDSGLVIHPDTPYIAASPDGIVSCDCCGQSCMEIKCPFCLKGKVLSDGQNKPSFLQQTSDGTLQLDKKHAHFYQIQTQMGVTKLESCYFVVWTECDMHVERVLFDESFWQEICIKAKHLFDVAILPELVGKFYTRLTTKRLPALPLATVSTNSETDDNHEKTWCYCGQVESGNMICCDNENCRLTWFHYKCLKMSSAPKGKWFCPDCRKLNAMSKRRINKPCA